MLNIRGKCFETNSSSMDQYDEYEENYESYVPQTVIIKFNLDENTTDERFYNIGDIVEDNINKFEECLSGFYSHLEKIELDAISSDEFRFEVYSVTYSVSYDTRNGSVSIKDKPDDGVPPKGDTDPYKESVKKDILNLLKNLGITEILEVTDLYSYPVAYIDPYDYIDW